MVAQNVPLSPRFDKPYDPQPGDETPTEGDGGDTEVEEEKEEEEECGNRGYVDHGQDSPPLSMSPEPPLTQVSECSPAQDAKTSPWMELLGPEETPVPESLSMPLTTGGSFSSEIAGEADASVNSRKRLREKSGLTAFEGPARKIGLQRR